MSAFMSSSFLILLIYSLLFYLAQSSTVPPSDQFKFVNKGKFGSYSVEYGASYRVLSIFKSPYHLCFYNTTPNAFTLALGMGHLRPNLLVRWVWEANRGLPVEENASFSFGSDGNLVLASAGGQVVWQSNTANKGAVGFKVLPNGNMVVYDSRNNYLWQSFHGPITDTLLVGQSFGYGLADRLVSRASESVNANGPYSLRLIPIGLGFYYQSKNSPNPYLYFAYGAYFTRINASTLAKEVATFAAYPNPEGDGYPDFIAVNSSVRESLLEVGVYRDSTQSFLRLDVEGNLRAFTFYDKANSKDWEETSTTFSPNTENECHMPKRCGDFGVCVHDQCVACPSISGGLVANWTESCAPPKVPACGGINNNNFDYYKIGGVDHFSVQFTTGRKVKNEGECRTRCSTNCKCLGYFYHQVEMRCWTVNDLDTLTQVTDSTHVGYIKYSKN